MRAQGEVTIREALRELDLWGAAAVFALTDYEDSQKRQIQIIKDWKEIINQAINLFELYLCSLYTIQMYINESWKKNKQTKQPDQTCHQLQLIFQGMAMHVYLCRY